MTNEEYATEAQAQKQAKRDGCKFALHSAVHVCDPKHRHHNRDCTVVQIKKTEEETILYSCKTDDGKHEFDCREEQLVAGK